MVPTQKILKSAIIAAVDLAVDGIEIDVQSCLDDYMIIHDTWLDRTTSGRGKANACSKEQIQQYDAGNGEVRAHFTAGNRLGC